MWKSSIVSASDRIFPGLACHDREKEFYDLGNVINANLPLQIMLYVNVRYAPFWLLFLLYQLDKKYYDLSNVYKIVLVAIFLSVTIFEILRLYFGYVGNLAEKIPELASFWLISTFLQFPMVLFLVIDKNSAHRLERISNITSLLFVFIEIVIGTYVLKRSAEHHAKRYYMAQMYGIDDDPILKK